MKLLPILHYIQTSRFRTSNLRHLDGEEISHDLRNLTMKVVKIHFDEI